MGDFAQFIECISLVLQKTQNLIMVFFRNRWLARHNPDIIALRTANDRLRVVLGQINNAVFCFKGPDKLHFPDSIAGIFNNKALGGVGFKLAVQSAFVEGEGCRYGSVALQAVGFNRIVGIFFDKGLVCWQSRTTSP